MGGGKICKDLDHWQKRKAKDECKVISLVRFLIFYPEFRSLFYHRIGTISRYVFFTCHHVRIYIWTKSKDIGGGLYIGHGWGTVINAKKIGENCLIAQNVTIGSKGMMEPCLSNNVCVWSHAVVLGDIVIGENSQIGTGSVVVKDVPSNSVVVPAKSEIIRKDNEKVRIPL